MALVGLAFACIAGTAQAAAACPNEALRTGLSASLPDCRAYEMLTPSDKSGLHEDLGAKEAVKGALVASNGDALALKTFVTLGSDPEPEGSFSLVTRTPMGWELTPVRAADAGGALSYRSQIFNPNLTQIGVDSSEVLAPLSPEEPFQIGPPGGPYTTVAVPPNEQHVLRKEGKVHNIGDATELVGATPDFSHVVLVSIDHALLPGTPTGTDEDAYDLYEWVKGKLRLVALNNEGKLISKCGATLGYGRLPGGGFPELHTKFMNNAISADGSKVFFTSPDQSASGEGCAEATRLYMRVTEMASGTEEGKTTELSAPEGVTEAPDEEEMPAIYEGAAADGSKVFFVTEKALTADAAANNFHLYEYQTGVTTGKRLKVVFQEPITGGSETNESEEVFVADDGSVVYFYRHKYAELYRYEARDGGSVHQIVSSLAPPGEDNDETPIATPNGEFFLFASEGVAGEPRGGGRNEVYRYDHADESVTCVSCGSGVPPATTKGFMGNANVGSITATPHFDTPDETPEFTTISEDGSRVFFESTASLVPQATSEGLLNVYEWETDGAGACTQSLGCTYLISQGNNASNSVLIGASADGSDVFFLTHSQLVPQDTDNVGDIYDARVDGGFPSSAQSTQCLGDTCLSVTVAPNDPTPASSSFSGPGNPAPLFTTPKPTVTPKAKCRKGRVRKKGGCVQQRKAKKTARRTAKRNRGGSK